MSHSEHMESHRGLGWAWHSRSARLGDRSEDGVGVVRGRRGLPELSHGLGGRSQRGSIQHEAAIS